MAFLLQRAAGDALVPVFIDNGLLRLDEGKQVTERLQNAGLNVRYYDASDYFLDKLAGCRRIRKKNEKLSEQHLWKFLKRSPPKLMGCIILPRAPCIRTSLKAADIAARHR